MRILLVSQMYPSAAAPGFGVFVQGLERELAARGHAIERVVLDRRGGGKLRHARLALRAVRAARRFRPDVVYAHFLFPTGFGALLAARAVRAPLVVTAHGQDVANATEYPFVRPFIRRVVRGAASVIAVSDWLRARLEQSAAGGARQDRGRQLRRRPTAVQPAAARRARRPRLRLRRLVDRAEERRAAGRRVRATRRGDAHVRRRRPAAVATRRPAERDGDRRGAARRACPATSPRPTSSASRASSSRSARRRSRRSPRRAASSRRESAGRRSSCRRKRACSSTPRTRPRSQKRSRQPPLFQFRIRPRVAAAEKHDVRLQATRVEEILERAVRDRRA